MALYCYFKPADDALPSPTGHLLSSVSLVTIRAAKEVVKERAPTPSSKSREAYAQYTPVQQAKIGRYASIHGNLPAVRHLCTLFYISLSVHCFVKSMCETNLHLTVGARKSEREQDQNF